LVNAFLALVGVVVTAGVSGWVGYQAAQNAMHDREARIGIAEAELATKIDHFEQEQAEKRRQADQSNHTTEISEQNKLSIEENRIAVELKRLGFQSGVSDNEAYLAASRFVHEQQVAEAELIRSFADRLLGETEKERSFALCVLSAYVSPEVIERIAAGGEAIVSKESLEKLAAVERYEISKVARSILERRKSSSKSNETQSAVG
jgi:hypothetical protein